MWCVPLTLERLRRIIGAWWLLWWNWQTVIKKKKTFSKKWSKGVEENSTPKVNLWHPHISTNTWKPYPCKHAHTRISTNKQKIIEKKCCSFFSTLLLCKLKFSTGVIYSLDTIVKIIKFHKLESTFKDHMQIKRPFPDITQRASPAVKAMSLDMGSHQGQCYIF